ncbi:hypothetical protein [Streptomyces cadmiisoli]|uniref:hypothetical protein n=1 Tax=Streptomyces cadmiisoli TaxID=2184053 RepID=UPI00365AA89D
MLDVAYEAVDDLPPGRLAEITEDRGRIRVRLDKGQPLADVVRQLNIEIEQLMSSGNWFQWWENEVVSRDTPDCSIRIRYVFRDWVTDGVGVAEDRGIVSVYIDPALTVAQFVASMNPATDDFLSGGQWFQLYAGEIIDNGQEPMSQV